MTDQNISEPHDTNGALETAARWSLAVTQRLAAAGVFIMLLIAAISMIDIIVFRTILNSAVTGFNEILQTFFAAALAAVLAGGIAQRSSLRVDMLLKTLKSTKRGWLDLAGEIFLLIFLVVLAIACWEQTLVSLKLQTQTTILHIPTAPVVAAISLFITLCAPVQFVNVLLSLKAASTAGGYHGRRIMFAAGAVAIITVLVISGVMAGVDLLAPFAWENSIIWAVVIFGLLWIMVLSGVPIGACLGFSGLAGAALLLGWGKTLTVVGNETTDLFMDANLALIPLFLMMGALASIAGLSTDIYRLAQAVLGSRRGGLAMATAGACAGFGALTGSSIATAATIGSVAIPQMRDRGYAPSLASGCIAAGATLGQLVPPSTIIVLYALLVEESIGTLYVAVLVPALLTVLLYLAAIALLVRMKPELAPGTEPFKMGELLRALRGGIVVLSVFSTVIGGIYFGVFTATEAASIGVVVTFFAALLRGKLKGEALWRAATETTNSIAMIYPLIVGALLLTFFLDLAGLPAAVTEFVGGLGLAPVLTIILLCVMYILLGSVMDSIAVMMITAGLVAPLVVSLGYDPIWWGIMMVVIVELGVVTPPFGLNLFMLKSIAPDIPTSQIYKGVAPFVAADVFKVALMIAFPALVLWLPSTMR